MGVSGWVAWWAGGGAGAGGLEGWVEWGGGEERGSGVCGTENHPNISTSTAQVCMKYTVSGLWY